VRRPEARLRVGLDSLPVADRVERRDGPLLSPATPARAEVIE